MSVPEAEDQESTGGKTPISRVKLTDFEIVRRTKFKR